MTEQSSSSDRWRVGSVRAGDLRRPGAVYVGRQNRALRASPLANPFRLDPRRPRDEQPEVLTRYAAWLDGMMLGATPASRELERLRALEPGILVCWCRAAGEALTATNRCHADIIADAIARLRKE